MVLAGCDNSDNLKPLRGQAKFMLSDLGEYPGQALFVLIRYFRWAQDGGLSFENSYLTTIVINDTRKQLQVKALLMVWEN